MTQPARVPVGLIVAAIAVAIWAVGLTVLAQTLGWGTDQVLLALGLDRPGWLWPVISLVNGALVAGPAALLAYLPQAPAVRAAGRAWLAGATAVAVLGSLRAVPATEPELHLLLLALAAAGLGYAWRRRPAGPGRTTAGLPYAVGAGLLVLLPWLWAGALGGAVETLAAIAAAATLGWLAASILDPLWPAVDPAGASPVRRVVVGGLVAGVALVLVAGGAGGTGAQLPLLLVLPPLGFAAAALASPGGRWPVAVLLGVAAFGPLGFIDPEEVTLLLIGRDVPFWVGIATLASLLLALSAGLAGLAAGPAARLVRDAGIRRWAGAALVGVLVTAAGAVHLGLGQPGLHGDRLFVIMTEQADLTGLPTGTGQSGRDARAQEVYRRLVAQADASQADLRADLDRFGVAHTPYYLVNAVEVVGGPEVRAWLSGREDVDRVLRSQHLRPLPALGSPESGRTGLAPADPEWSVAMIGADRVWSELGVTGSGVVVGSSDSGVDGAHPALADGFRGGADSWLDPWNGASGPTDRSGHGTHTLGSAVGRGGIGVAPGAQWTACVNLDRNLGNPPYYLDCLQFMLAPYPAGGDPFRDGRTERAPHVLTNSWACPAIEGCDNETLRPATAALAAAGIYVVVAAGNSGPSCESIQEPPAPYADVITVGAVDRDGQVADFSSRGPAGEVVKPDLVAPGADVISAMPGGGYAAQSGTSMATPHLAGVVALMWSANPALIGDLATTTSILRDTARPVAGPEQPACGGLAALAGAGLVDAFAAVRLASLAGR